MAAEKLGAYILDHDEKSFLIKDSQLQKIEYSSGKVMVAGEEQIFKYTTTYENTIKLSLRDFIKSIKENDFSINREKVLDSLKIIDSAYKSFAENKIIKINY